MDAHEAILEQLRLARAKGLETVADRLTAAAEGLDAALGRVRAAIHDLDPAEADSVLPLADIDEAIVRLGERARVAEEQAAEARLRADAVESRSVGGGLDLELVRTLDAASSQSELLRELLPLLADHCGRAVVLVLRSGQMSAWSGIGFADGEVLRSWTTDPTRSPILDRFASDALPVSFEPVDDPVFAEWLAGDDRAEEALLLPVVLRGKMMGGLYVDRVGDRPWNPRQAQALVALACWMIDTLHHRQQTPSAMLAEPIDLRPHGDRTADLDAGVPIVEVTPEEETGLPSEPEFDPSATMRVDMTEMASAAPAPPRMEAEEPVEPVVQVEAEGVSVEEQPEVTGPEAEFAAEPPVEPPPVQPIEPPISEAAEVEPVEPPPVRPVQPPPPVEAAEPVLGERSPEDEARHEEARRFARLLVSEIKLYNEDDVERGRENSDLYQRLKEDIDRSREMYEKRIPEEIRSAQDYFHAELVRILADGDSDALGM
jgi:hypothetical protein